MTLHVPAREIPVPQHLSPEARAVLRDFPAVDMSGFPDLRDKSGWRAHIAAMDAQVLSRLSPWLSDANVVTDTLQFGDVKIYAVTPRNVPATSRGVYLDIHGGGLIAGGGECCRVTAMLAAARLAMPVWAVDYRMPPDYPYPVPLDDCLSAYRMLLQDHAPADIVIGGISAGGNLAAALVLRARDEGLPLPAGLVLGTPEVDLTESGDSFFTNMGVDSAITTSLMPANLLYAAGHDLKDPYISPLFGDFGEGFPPTLLYCGTRDLFLSNTVRMHRALRAAGIFADLHVIEAAPHGGFGGTPEDRQMGQEVSRFVSSVLANADQTSPS